jgi:hypothetical protein
MSVWKLVNDLSYDKKDLYRSDSSWDKEYQPFIINRAFSYHPDTVILANEMNRRSHLEKGAQNDYYHAIIRKRKRWSPWHKAPPVGDVEILKEVYGYSDRRATEAIAIIPKEELTKMKEKWTKGGQNT